jgi:pilus assembly protein TadC
VTALVVLLVAVSAWLSFPTGRRLDEVVPRPAAAARKARPLPIAAVSGLLGVLIAMLVGNGIGVVLGIGAAIGAARFLGRLEPAEVRRRREGIARQAPEVADLLAATLASGAPPVGAIRAVCRAIGPPVDSELEQIAALLALGASPEHAWAVLPDEHPLAGVRDAFIRSARSGASLHLVLSGLADDLRRRHHLAVEVAARAAGVKAVGPLAVCFLPAFVLIGVVPVVASFAGNLL